MTRPRAPYPAVSILALLLLSGCQNTQVRQSPQHLTAPAPQVNSARIPAPVDIATAPAPADKLAQTYTVVVSRPMPARELLATIARDARLNIDVDPQINGQVTINAIRQTLPQILDRLAKQIDLRWELENGTLIVQPDKPFLKQYTVDYVNMARSSKADISVSSNLGGVSSGTSGSGQSASGNGSTLQILNTADNKFWERLTKNLEDMLREEDRVSVITQIGQQRLALAPVNASAGGTGGTGTSPSTGSSSPAAAGNTLLDQLSALNPYGSPTGPAAGGFPALPGQNGAGTQLAQVDRVVNIIAHPETGTLSVRGTARQHKRVQEFLERVRASAQRQVMIEATIAEVELSREYQAGVDWARILKNGSLIAISKFAGVMPSASTTTPYALITYQNGDVAGALKMLETFGRTKVLSSPKLMALNNQSAVLKVVTDIPYFTVKVTRDTTTSTTGTSVPSYTYESTVHTVPEGIVMSVMPQISETGQISLNVRPTITNVTGYITDPAVALVNPAVVSQIPQVQVRELESTLRLTSGEIGVLGGLIQDRVEKEVNGIPVLGQLPYLGTLFGNRKEKSSKTELVVFLKPTLVRDASINGDLRAFKPQMPDDKFFSRQDDFRQVGGEALRSGSVYE